MRLHRLSALLILAVAATLAGPAAAHAKQISALAVCGASGCADRTAALHGDAVFDMGALVAEPARAERFVRLDVRVSEPGRPARDGWSILFLPRSGLVRGHDEAGRPVWSRAAADRRADLRRLVRGVAPYPPALLPLAARRVHAEPVDLLSSAPATTRSDGRDATALVVAAAAVVALLGLGVAALRARRSHRPRT